MIGKIYKYTSPSGKIYIGQTTNEEERRKNFLSPLMSYAGQKMESERRKYPELKEWEYEILYQIEDEFDKLQYKLDFLEAISIVKYDSIYNGLNTVLGNYSILKDNMYLKCFYKKCSDKEKNKILHCMREEVSHISIKKEPKMLLDSFWSKELAKRDKPIMNKLIIKEINTVNLLLSKTHSNTREQKLSKKMNRLLNKLNKLNGVK